MHFSAVSLSLPRSVGWLALAVATAATPAINTAHSQSAESEVTRPARQNGAGFEFRRGLSSIDNPFCAIVTYVLPDFAEQASSSQDGDGRPVIVVDAATLTADRAYGHFLMAHECCHHTLGHTRLTSQSFGHLGPQPFYYLRPLLKNMELDADGCAVRMLTRTKEFDAIESARKKMLEFGAGQTGAYYPTGIERADNITHIAAEH